MTVRDHAKYPYLQKNLNTKRRQDYLDNIFYVDGVKSVDRTQKEDGIRALNADEKEWLNRFNKEFLIALTFTRRRPQTAKYRLSGTILLA